MQNDKIVVSVVIPVFNSSDSLIELSGRLKVVFEKNLSINYEIIFVDDGSSNKRTWPILQELALSSPQIMAIKLQKNFGKHGAVLAGFVNCKGSYIVTMDDDLQHAPEDIPNLFELKAHNIVIAEFKSKRHGLFKRWASNVKGKLENLIFNKPKDVSNSPFKLINANIINSILKLNTSKPFISGMLFSVTSDIVNVSISHNPREYGKSQYTLYKQIKQFRNLMFNHSSIPLRIMSIVGAFSFVICLIWASIVAYDKIYHGIEVNGWASLMIVQLFLNGFVLLGMGIIGEYLHRIISLGENNPPFIIDRVVKD